MKDAELEKLPLKQLVDLKGRVDRLLSSKQDEARIQLREKFKSMAEQAGFSLAEVVGGISTSKSRVVKGRAKAAAKYANPADSSQTWSGRGRMPNWLSGKLKSGSKLADFAL